MMSVIRCDFFPWWWSLLFILAHYYRDSMNEWVNKNEKMKILLKRARYDVVFFFLLNLTTLSAVVISTINSSTRHSEYSDHLAAIRIWIRRKTIERISSCSRNRNYDFFPLWQILKRHTNSFHIIQSTWSWNMKENSHGTLTTIKKRTFRGTRRQIMRSKLKKNHRRMKLIKQSNLWHVPVLSWEKN